MGGRGGRGWGRGGPEQRPHEQQPSQGYYDDGSRGGRGGGGDRGGRGGRGWGRGAPEQRPQEQQPTQASPSPTPSVYSDDGSQGGRGRGGDRGRMSDGSGGRGRGRGAPEQRPQEQQPPQGDRGGRGARGQQARGGGGQGRGQGGPGFTQPPQEFQQQPIQVPAHQPIQAPVQQPTQAPTQMQTPDQLAGAVSRLDLSSPSGGQSKDVRSGVKGTWIIPERKIKCDKNNMVGTRGRVIEIEVNHLLLSLKKQKPAIHYDCAFKPDVPKKLLRYAMEEMRKKHYPNRYPAFDGRKNLYSSGELPFNGEKRDTVFVNDPERDQPKEFDVTIKQVSVVDMNQIAQYLSNGVSFPQDAIQALDIVLRNPSAMRFTAVGRSYFTRPQNQIISLGNGLELWYGFYQSAVLGWKPFLNVDVAHKGFPEEKNLLDVMLDIKAKSCRFNDPRPTRDHLQKQGLNDRELEDFNKFIRGLKIVYIIPDQPNTRRVYKMNGTRKSAVDQRFTLENGQTMSVGEYFKRDKHYALRFPHLPVIHVGNPQRDVCLPPELCTIVPGQVTNRKMDDVQTANMVKAAARPADERKFKIMAAMKAAGFNQDKCIGEFGVTVSQDFQRVKARVLNPPSLEYRRNKVRVQKGVWRAGEFVTSNRLEHWVVVSLGRTYENDLWKFGSTMIQQGRALGMDIAEPRNCISLSDQMRKIYNGDQLKKLLGPMFEGFKKDGVQLVVVVIVERPPDTYSKVKLTAEVDVGLLTQCIKERTMSRMNPATAGNILLKINAKLNGVNHTVDRSFCPALMDAPTMLVGADVTHPSPDQTTIPSVAAVAASHDRRAFQYNMIWRLQPPREEIIVDLERIMKDQFMFFYQKTGQRPVKVIFYRDGVSEGQFSKVLETEMSAIRRACQSLNANYKPTVTFLVVQKRHHTRFFPTRAEDEDGRNKNVPPGTIVDTVITHPKEMDFYLVSHASLQGTSRPTKYHKLWDENNISEDDLEELTFYLCHLFSRCTRSVSYPAPTYYAHLAAARGRVYLEGSSVNLNQLPLEMTRRTIQNVIVQDSPMFFV